MNPNNRVNQNEIDYLNLLVSDDDRFRYHVDEHMVQMAIGELIDENMGDDFHRYRLNLSDAKRILNGHTKDIERGDSTIEELRNAISAAYDKMREIQFRPEFWATVEANEGRIFK